MPKKSENTKKCEKSYHIQKLTEKLAKYEDSLRESEEATIHLSQKELEIIYEALDFCHANSE